jgi:hypothetical protein
MKKLLWSLAFLSVLGLAVSALAQVQNGAFTGTVTDPSGAAVPNAKVTITNLGTNASVAITTNNTGLFNARELPPGTYRLSAEAPGFKTFTNNNIVLNAGTNQRVDFKMSLGQAREVVEVSGEAAAVNTEDAKLATTVGATQISNLPLNGRNVYDLIQMAPGAVNVAGVDFENGHNTVVNGLREDFNGFLINGVSNKGLSGGVVTTPVQDTVQEFQQLELNVSAQYGNSAGSINNLVTKSGTNSFHGSAWEYVRNDVFDANQYFLNQQPDPRKDPNGTLCTAGDTSKCFKPAVRFNQFGGTFGGPVIKDKLFFFGSYQGDRFSTVAPPTTVQVESQQWRDTVAAAFPNSVANLLYSNFKPLLPGINPVSLNNYVPLSQSTDPNGTQVTSYGKISTYVPANVAPAGTPIFAGYLCPDNNSSFYAAKFAHLLGVTPTDIAIMNAQKCSATPGPVTGVADRTAPFELSSVAVFGSQIQTLGNLFNGTEASGRLDFNPNSANRIYAQYNYFKETDKFGPCLAPCTRGFTNPERILQPSAQFSWVHTFSPHVLNELRVGYTQNNNPLINAAIPGVPQIGGAGLLDDGSAGFGSYSGYPQTFVEHIYTYSDMVSISHGNHNMKVGADFRRNLENSTFSVARPSYEVFDPVFFAADAPAEETAGVDPGICSPPCKSFNQNPIPQLASNGRHWRNLEVGAYFQDDWKVTRRLTLNLGLRWDLFTRHTEEDNLATTFIPGPGTNALDWVTNANNPNNCVTPSQIALAQLAGECGPGGFAPSPRLGKGDHNNFGPRVGFAWDVLGDGKTSFRGGFGVSYEGTLYNPLSNSRWNLPYYSFNFADNVLNGDVNTVIYGPTTCNASGCTPSGATPTFTGPATNPGQGLGAQATGNLTGWAPSNPNVAILTGIIFPQGVRDPYVYNYFLSLQHEFPGRFVLETNYVGTTGHKIFRAENINRHPASVLPPTACITDNFGRNWCGNDGFANNNYGNLRAWENDVNSNYNALQVSVKKQMTHGVLLNVNYTYSHAIDEGSTWHSGATTANGAAAGEGYTTDQTLPQIDRGNALFDIRQRLVLNYVWQLPGQNLKGVLGALLGGWSYNGIWAFQTGAHWEPYTSSAAKLSGNSDPTLGPLTGCFAVPFIAANCTNSGGDYNLDHGRNDRPNSTIANFAPSRAMFEKGWAGVPGANVPIFSSPCLGCVGNLGRNTFLGPGAWYADMTLSKNIKITERVNLKFDAQGFNVFNHANFIMATAGGGAHNKITDSSFGQAAGTLNARNIQLGLKLSF